MVTDGKELAVSGFPLCESPLRIPNLREETAVPRNVTSLYFLYSMTPLLKDINTFPLNRKTMNFWENT